MMPETKTNRFTKVQQLFLDVMNGALRGEQMQFDDSVTVQDAAGLLVLASQQNVLPMVYESVFQNEVFNELPAADAKYFKNYVFSVVMRQVRKTAEFLTLYKHFEENGLRPVVFKGIVCRNLYPKPDNRPSGDEDLYVPEEQFEACQEILEKEGMQIAEHLTEVTEKIYEVPYFNKKGVLCIELHRGLFDKDDAYEGMNELFDHVFDETVDVNVMGQNICTMPPTKHMLFLVLHAYKHFLSGGFGLRQVCDMSMFANAYGSEIDWDTLFALCRSVHGEVFALSLFEICIQYLGMDMEKACYREEFRAKTKDPANLLRDILDAGIFGGSDMDRKHSSTMTIKAVGDDRSGEDVRKHKVLLRTAFPSREAMMIRYPYVKDHPILLPFAWTDRLIKYFFSGENRSEAARHSMEIGYERIELLKEYGIIKK